ncbi:uncharacterized protein Bfra_005130 [Botrytis fragariae]|uniref:Uncharacterized protein n=1 Tax=Botrytis fragariae TaxID=1964551 RepID=A0A8H6AU66_9HELO|nr:uncharacterized protein Bfra_005130 [Botrytis fragariae]KAF5873666.1 hypothetical protein Bfra_005130 [Botrytis fragariae]
MKEDEVMVLPRAYGKQRIVYECLFPDQHANSRRTPKKARAPKNLTVEGKAKLVRWLVQTEPCVIRFIDILTQAQEDELIKKHRPVGKGHGSSKWVVRLHVHTWKAKKKTPLDKESRRMVAGCGARLRGRGKNIKECAKNLRFTIDNPDSEEDKISKAEQDEEKKAEKQLEENIGGDGTEVEDDETEEEIEGKSGKGSEEDGSLATVESERKNSNEGSEQEETNEEQVGDEGSNDDDADDEDVSSAEADNQNQAIDKQSLQPKKRGRQSPGESSRSSSGGAVKVERSGMSELALKNRMKSPKKKQKTGNERDAEGNVEQEVELDGEKEAGENSGL